MAAASRSRPMRVTLVAKRSAWRMYVEERHDERLTELAAAGDEAIAPLKASHEAHVRTVREVKEALAAVGAHLVAERLAGEPFDSAGLDLVVTVGGDGTLLAASHYVADVPVLCHQQRPGALRGLLLRVPAAARRSRRSATRSAARCDAPC